MSFVVTVGTGVLRRLDPVPGDPRLVQVTLEVPGKGRIRGVADVTAEPFVSLFARGRGVFVRLATGVLLSFRLETSPTDSSHRLVDLRLPAEVSSSVGAVASHGRPAPRAARLPDWSTVDADDAGWC